jgi:hypothetical protein
MPFENERDAGRAAMPEPKISQEAAQSRAEFWRELNDALLNAGQPEATYEEVRVVNGWSVAGAVQHLAAVRS